MSKFVVAVCDTDDMYRGRFVTYLVEHEAGKVMVHSFSLPKVFLEEIERRKFDVALIGSGFYETEEILRSLEIPLLRLVDAMPESVAEQEDCFEENIAPVSKVFKYQAMEAVIHEMRILAAGQTIMSNEAASLHGLEIIGIYSPIKHEMQMPYSVISAVAFADKRKVLYVNLMANSGFLELFQSMGEYDIGDVIIRLRNQRLLPETFFRSVYEMNRIAYIPPFSNPEHLHELTLKDYHDFLGFIEEKTDFETVVIDFEDVGEQFAGMLKACSAVYCPVKSGYFYDCQIRQFMGYLKTAFTQETLEKIHLVEVPFSAKRIRAGNNVLEQLLYSEFGDYVRNDLMGAADESQ